MAGNVTDTPFLNTVHQKLDHTVIMAVNFPASTAGAAFTLTLPSLIDVEDGHKIVFQDTEGTAATNNVTLDGSGSETIKNGASTATTLVLSTNYFSITLRADVGADCWVVE